MATEQLPELELPEQKQQQPAKSPKKLFWTIIKIFAGVCLGLIFLVIIAIAGGFAWLQTDKAQAWLIKTVNPILEENLQPQGLNVQLTRLSGFLPFDFVVGFEVADKNGIWLVAPENRFEFDWRALPGSIHIKELKSVQPQLARLPELPPSPPPPPSPPLTQSSLRAMLDTLEQSLTALPNWIPPVQIDNVAVENVSLAEPLLGFKAESNLGVGLSFAVAQDEQSPVQTELLLKTLDFHSDIVNLSSKLAWKNGNLKQWLNGLFDLQVDLLINAPAEKDKLPAGFEALAMLNKPFQVKLAINGPLLQPDLHLDLDCEHLAANGHNVKDTKIALQATPLNWAGFIGLQEKLEELSMHVKVAGSVDEHHIAVATALFAQMLDHERFDLLKAGLRDLALDGLGLKLSGKMQADVVPDTMPLLNGTLQAHIEDWQAISSFVPGQKLSGQVDLLAECQTEKNTQNARVQLNIPRFSLTPDQGKSINLQTLSADVKLKDVFGKPMLDALLNLAEVATDPIRLGAKMRADGSLQGPLNVRLDTTGGVTSTADVTWHPGKVLIRTLAAKTSSGLLMPDKKTKKQNKKDLTLGFVSSGNAELHYGQNGTSVKGLDIKILPSGRMRADGGLSPGKVDLKLTLADLTLAPWRALVEALPTGTVEAKVDFVGSPIRPSGKFRFGVRQLKLDQVKLAPFDIALVGSIENKNGSVLNAYVELPKNSVRTLGGEEAQIQASLPLRFDATGIPTPNMNGAMSGKVVWHGALSPLWKLSPLTDRRLTGKIDLDTALSGSLNAPILKAALKVKDARYEDPIVGLLLQKINLNVDVDGKKGKSNPLEGFVNIDLSALDGLGGKVQVTGKTPLNAENLDITATLDHLRPLRRQDVRISLSGKAQVKGSATAPVVTGDILINQGAVMLDYVESGPASIVTLPISTEKKKAQSPTPPKEEATKPTSNGPGSLDIRIRAPGRFLVDGRGLFSEWRTFMRITGTPLEPVITGELSAIKGDLDFMNKKFDLTRGTVSFVGGSLANPLLDILLTNETVDFTSYIAITGTVKKMKLELSSDPAMPRDEVLSHILFGRNVNELSQFETLQLAQAVAQLAGLGGGGGALDFTRKALGVDVLRVKSSGASGDSSGGASVETGKYINDRVYVGVEQGLGTKGTAGIIQLEVTPRVKAEVRTEQNNTSTSLGWKYNY